MSRFKMKKVFLLPVCEHFCSRKCGKKVHSKETIVATECFLEFFFICEEKCEEKFNINVKPVTQS